MLAYIYVFNPWNKLFTYNDYVNLRASSTFRRFHTAERVSCEFELNTKLGVNLIFVHRTTSHQLEISSSNFYCFPTGKYLSMVKLEINQQIWEKYKKSTKMGKFIGVTWSVDCNALVIAVCNSNWYIEILIEFEKKVINCRVLTWTIYRL